MPSRNLCETFLSAPFSGPAAILARSFRTYSVGVKGAGFSFFFPFDDLAFGFSALGGAFMEVCFGSLAAIGKGEEAQEDDEDDT